MFARTPTSPDQRSLTERIQRLTDDLANADVDDLRTVARRVAFRLRRIALQLERGADPGALDALDRLSERLSWTIAILTQEGTS